MKKKISITLLYILSLLVIFAVILDKIKYAYFLMILDGLNYIFLKILNKKYNGKQNRLEILLVIIIIFCSAFLFITSI